MQVTCLFWLSFKNCYSNMLCVHVKQKRCDVFTILTFSFSPNILLGVSGARIRFENRYHSIV